MRLQNVKTWLIAGALALVPALAWAQDAQGPDLQVPEPETLGLLAAAVVAAIVVRRIGRK